MQSPQHLSGDKHYEAGNGMTTQTSSRLPERHSPLELEIANILRALNSASQQDLTDSRCRWIPRDQVFAVVSAEAVRNLLQSRPALLEDQHPAFEELVARICPPINDCRCGSRHCTGGRIIFAACLSLSKRDLIVTLLLESSEIVCDAHLAQLELGTDNQNYLVETLRQTLSSAEIDRFEHFTWQMRSPLLEGLAWPGAGQSDILEFPQNASLPWIDRADVKETGLGENSIQKIVVHRGHAQLDTLRGDLVLKTFNDGKLQAEDRYKCEVAANRRTPLHERIVPLLSAFKHRGKFHVVLPWASGGNLADLFEQHATPQATSWYSEDWLLAECLGLADGLRAVHEAPNHEVPNHEAPKSAQIHADIKPENILCFASGEGDRSTYTLRLTDFGESLEVDPLKKTVESRHVSRTLTYRPPEFDTADVLNLKYDVWCLGCVFFEFVTWAIAGHEAIEQYELERLYELNDHKVKSLKGDHFEDTFFKKVSGRTAYKFLSPSNFSFEKVTVDARKVEKGFFQRQYSLSFNYTRTVKAVVKAEFKKHIALLKSSEGVSRKLLEFLDFIEKRMLVVDTEKRASSAEVCEFFGTL